MKRYLYLLALTSAVVLAATAPPEAVANDRVTITQVPPRGTVNSSQKSVAAIGNLRIVLEIRTAALFNIGGRSSYKISVRRSNPGSNDTELTSKTVIAGSDKVPVEFIVPIDKCNRIGNYYVRVANVSEDNPQRAIVSGLIDNEIHAFSADPVTRNLSMAGVTVLDLDRGNERTVSIGAFSTPGSIALKGKWHVPGLLPTFKPVKIYLLRPDDSIAKSGIYYSIHSSGSGTKMDFYYIVNFQDAAQTGQWKLRIVNPGDTRIEGFNIQKGSDINPMVPAFKSFFTTACGA